MARIKIEDLPVGRELTKEETDEIVGRARFRPSFESLEERALMSTSALLPPAGESQASGSLYEDAVTETIGEADPAGPAGSVATAQTSQQPVDNHLIDALFANYDAGASPFALTTATSNVSLPEMPVTLAA
jgi:hypothetical protein